MPNINTVKSKNSSERIYRSPNTSISEKQIKSAKINAPKKVGIKCPKDVKCCSAGALNSNVKGPLAKPKKTTKSDLCFDHNNFHGSSVMDYCKKCGDQIDAVSKKSNLGSSGDAEIVRVISEPSSKSSISTVPSKSVERVVISSKPVSSRSSQNIPSTSKVKNKSDKTKTRPKFKKVIIDNDEKILVNGQSVKEFYKNENFCKSTESAQEVQKYLKNISLLDTIKELPETIVDDDGVNLNTIYKLCSCSDESSSDDDYVDSTEYDSLRKVKEFRDDNYFETHSVDSRIHSKGSVTSLVDHKCVYRFYLNDRLFPVPLKTDHKKTIRCTECHLPLDLNRVPTKDINGTIQAKVKLGKGDKAQDMVLMLPVKDSLIIKQKRKEPEKNEEVVYFGVIKLDSYGNSVFNQTLPSDSLALKYQKGYREFRKPLEECEYKKSDDCEVIVI